MIARKFLDLARVLLDDDHGISERAYNALVELGVDVGLTSGEWENLFDKVDATDGRFYLPENS